MIFTYEDSWATSHAIKKLFYTDLFTNIMHSSALFTFLGAENSAKAKVNLLKAA